MAVNRFIIVIGTAVVAITTGAGFAHALTTMDAPVTSNGARYAAPDPDQRLEQGLTGQDRESERGFSIQVRPQPRDRDQSLPFSGQQPMLPWLPGQPFPSH
jgi:hypothetical protein